MTPAPVAPGPRPALRRTLRLWQVSLSGVGVILGAGVYALIGPAAREAGGALWLAFVLAASAAGLTAYSYARLGTMKPRNSPEFQYTALAFGPRAGFAAGWLMLAADLLAVATVALGFGGYLAHRRTRPARPRPAGAAPGRAPLRLAAPAHRLAQRRRGRGFRPAGARGGADAPGSGRTRRTGR